MPKRCFCVDIDHTLAVQLQTVNGTANPTNHLDCITISAYGKKHQYYSINTSAMGKIFAACLKQHIDIVIITSSAYPREVVLKTLENLYCLGADSLQKCVYIDRFKYYRPGIRKAEKLNRAKQDGLISKDAQLFLLDNNDKELAAAKEIGCTTIKAEGFPTHGEAVDNSYLIDCVQMLGLQVHLTMLEQTRYVKRLRMRC